METYKNGQESMNLVASFGNIVLPGSSSRLVVLEWNIDMGTSIPTLSQSGVMVFLIIGFMALIFAKLQ